MHSRLHSLAFYFSYSGSILDSAGEQGEIIFSITLLCDLFLLIFQWIHETVLYSIEFLYKSKNEVKNRACTGKEEDGEVRVSLGLLVYFSGWSKGTVLKMKGKDASGSSMIIWLNKMYS
jgi:hypothetical protein